MLSATRREFLRAGLAGAVGWGIGASLGLAGEEKVSPASSGKLVEVLNPRDRVPLSFIIDDSTCLVNMAHFGMPQFAEALPNASYSKKPWKTWPREIPDAFVREFGEWCAQHGVKGKYSVVPYPACVGWLDRELPGWSRQELRNSLALVRDLLVPNWDIHPEMITHTRVIDLKTCRPLEDATPAAMENWYPSTKKSVDELAAYISFALKILKNCGLPCEGVTTPGGFGNLVKSEFSQAVGEAVRDVFQAEVPHYFKYVWEGKESTQPRLEHVRNQDSDQPRLVVSVPAGTGDWFGNWDGDQKRQGFKYASADGSSGRLVDLIQRGEPAVMLCHWPGLYCHGTKAGFEDCKQVILALEGRFRDRTVWMKPSELARYWAAKDLTRIEVKAGKIHLRAPFACPAFTVRLRARGKFVPKLASQAGPVDLQEVKQAAALRAGTWLRQAEHFLVCFDLPRGQVTLGLS